MSSSVPCVFLVTAEALKSIDLVESHKARQDLSTQEKRCKGYINNYTPPTIFFNLPQIVYYWTTYSKTVESPETTTLSV